MGKYLKSSTEQVYVDINTGEEITTTTSKTFIEKVESTEHFFMTYIDFIAPWFNLKPEIAKSILMWMCQNAEFDTGKVSLTTQKRKDLCEKLQITPQTLSNALTSLKKSNLVHGKNGEFQINPQIFWKGSQKSRDALLKDKVIKMTFGIVDAEDIDNKSIAIEQFENKKENF